MITSADNPRVKQARALLEQRGRETYGLCLVEGVRLIEEALRAGRTPALVFFLDQTRTNPRAATLLEAAARTGADLMEVSSRVFGTLSDTVASQGMIATVAIPQYTAPEEPDFMLVLDQIRDPGNMGTIMRSAEAAGIHTLVLAPGCVDAWNPKVLRSGMGAHFRLPLITAQSWHSIEELVAGRPVWLAEAQGAVPYDAVDWTVPGSLIIGGEAAGISAEARRLGTGRVAIPMVGAAESLNAAMAATILVFEMARQRRVGHSR